MRSGSWSRLAAVSRTVSTSGRAFTASVNGCRASWTAATSGPGRSSTPSTAPRNASEASSILPSSSISTAARGGGERRAGRAIDSNAARSTP